MIYSFAASRKGGKPEANKDENIISSAPVADD